MPTDHKAVAKRLLNHYLQMALKSAGRTTDEDTTAEIDYIVDEIVAACVEEVLRTLPQRVDAVSKTFIGGKSGR